MAAKENLLRLTQREQKRPPSSLNGNSIQSAPLWGKLEVQRAYRRSDGHESWQALVRQSGNQDE